MLCIFKLKKRSYFTCSCIYSTLKCSSILVCFNEQRGHIAKSIIFSKLHYLDRVDVVNISLAFLFNPSLILMLSVNFRTFALFSRIPEICCLLILNASAKFVVPFSPFSKGEMIVCMSFVKRTDRFRLVMVINCFICMTASFYSIAKACI